MYNGQTVMHMCVGVLGSTCCLRDPVLCCGSCNGHAVLVCWERVLRVCLCIVVRAVDVLCHYAASVILHSRSTVGSSRYILN